MKAGMVVQVRVNTKNCLGILDVMEACGIDPYDGRSFAQCVSLTLDSLIGMARRAGVIPADEAGFQYLNRMAPFIDSRNDKKKHRYDDMLYKRAAAGVSAPDLSYKKSEVGQYVPAHLQSQDGYSELAKARTDEDNMQLAIDQYESYKAVLEGCGELPESMVPRWLELKELFDPDVPA